MWQRMDRAGAAKSPIRDERSPEEIWKESVGEFEMRMKELNTPNETRRQLARSTRLTLEAEILATQTPSSCESAKYLFVENDKRQFGFGAQLHHFVYTLIVGYASNRVIVIEKGGFKYAAEMNEWCQGDLSIECFFQPLGPCTSFISDQEGNKISSNLIRG